MTTLSRVQMLCSSVAITLLGMPLLTELVDAATTADVGDLATLNAAIELERAGIKAYDDAVATGFLTGHVAAVAERFRLDHVAHRDALIAAVKAGGGMPSEKIAKLAYPPLKNTNDVLAFVKTVEELAASTYLSVVPEFKDRRLAGVAASILGIETTHVALLSAALDQFPAYSSAFVQ